MVRPLHIRDMDLFNYDPQTFFSFLLTFMRISLVLFVMPFFGGEGVPKTVKAMLCLVLTLAVWPQLSFPGTELPASLWEILLMLLGELFIGLTLMLVVNFLFAAVQMGGQIMGFQMGFAMINVVDPLTGASVVITSHFLYMTTLLVFLTLNGHLIMLQGLADSFALIPPGGLLINPMLATTMLQAANGIFTLALKVAAPVMSAIILVDLALALVGRAAPQMHVLILGFPLKIATGFFFMGLLFVTLARHVGQYIINMSETLHTLLQAMG